MIERNEYQELAYRTAKPLPTKSEDLVHAALGLGSESGELADTISSAWMHLPFNVHNIAEELGDICWYAALMCVTMGWRFENMTIQAGDASEMSQPLAAAVIGRNPPAMTLVLCSFAGNILSVVKAHVMYGKELDETLLKRQLSLLVTTVELLASAHDIPFVEVVLAQNIGKLQKRYPDKYSDAFAIARADKSIHLIQ